MVGFGYSLEGRGGVMSMCVVSLDYLCRWQVQVQVSVYCVRRIPAHLRCTQCPIHVTLYRYLLPTMYLSVADIANPDLLGCGCRTWKSLDIARFYEEQCDSYPAGSHGWFAKKR